MPIHHLLYRHELPVNDKIKIVIPSVRDVLEHEEEYYNMVYMLTSSPYDMMVQLDDMGIDFTKIDDYELFTLMFCALQHEDTSLLFGDLDIKSFSPMVDTKNDCLVLRSNRDDITIDRSIHHMIASAIRRIHHLEHNHRTPANDAAREYILARERKKLMRKRRKQQRSQVEDLIVSLVNTEQFPYTFESVLDLTIYQFNESLRQVVKKIDFDNKIRAIYAGTISAKDINQDDLNWLVHQ